MKVEFTLADGTKHVVTAVSQKAAVGRFVATFKRAGKPNPSIVRVAVVDGAK